MSSTQNILKNTKKEFKAGLLVFFVFALLPLEQNYAQDLPDQYIEELRGVWITNVDSDVLFSRQSIVDAMDYLADRGFNVVFPVVWNKGYTLHPSEVALDAFGKNKTLCSLHKEEILFKKS